MVALGLLLMLACGAVAAAVLIEAHESVSPQIWGLTVDTNAAGMFAAGAAVMLVFLMAATLFRRGLARSHRRRREVKALKHGQNDELARLEQEKADLQAALEREHGTQGVAQDEVSGRRDAAAPVLVNRPAADGSTASRPDDSDRVSAGRGEPQPQRSVDLTDFEERESRRLR